MPVYIVVRVSVNEETSEGSVSMYIQHLFVDWLVLIVMSQSEIGSYIVFKLSPVPTPSVNYLSQIFSNLSAT